MYDRFSDVSRAIYKHFPDFPETIQQPSQSKDPEVDQEKEKDKIESRPLNYKEVKPSLKKQNVNPNNRNFKSSVVNRTKPKEKEEELKPKINNLNVDYLDTSEYDKKEQEMKDLDRLVNDLLHEASQIPDYDIDSRAIPYHARGDSLPFRYCPEGDIVKNSSSKRLGGHSEVYLPTRNSSKGVHSQEWNPLREPDSVDSNNWNVDVSAKTKVPEQKLAATPPKTYNIQVEEPVPKNWQNFQQQKRANEEFKPKTWTTVTVEHDESPKIWTKISDIDNKRDDWSSNNISIPVIHEKSDSRDWNNSQSPGIKDDSRDWNIYQDVQERNRSKTKEPRRQLKYGRSFSAEIPQDSDEWLTKQMAKLQLKRSASIRQQHPLNRQESAATPAWLVELKQRTAKAKTIENTKSNVVRTNTNIPIARIESSESPIPEPEIAELTSSMSTNLANLATPRFPSAPPTPYMNKSGSLNTQSHIQRAGRTHNFSQRSVPPMTDDDTEDEEEIAKIMFNRRQEEELKFTVDTSSSWYKPGATREEAINALANREVGTFIIRNSNSFPGAYGLAIKFDEHNVRHFLIEPTRAGVRLRGSSIEPVFSSLSALVYGHTIEPLALPCCLRLPSEDNLIPTSLSQSTTSKLLSQGAACQLLFLGSNNVEMLTGGEAIQRSISKLLVAHRPILVNLRLSKGGLVLTDVNRQKNHHNLSSIIYAGLDPMNRSITVHGKSCKLFGIVVSSNRNNNVLVLSEYEEGQPAQAIISFVIRVLQWRS